MDKRWRIWAGALALATATTISAMEFDFEDDASPAPGRDGRFARLEREAPLAGAASLRIDTRIGAGDWTSVWSTPPGALLPGRTYTITATVQVREKSSDDAHLLLLVRPRAANHPGYDAASLACRDVGAPGTVTLRVTVPPAPDDYAFRLDVHRGLLALVDNIVLKPDRVERFPATADAAPVALPEDLPTGAGEVVVEPPRQEGRRVLNARAFGVSPENADNTPAFQAAIDRIKQDGAPTLLTLEPGRYRFGGGAAATLFDGLVDFELDGAGATLVFHRTLEKWRLMEARNCRRVEFRDFTIDWDWDAAPLASVVRAERISPDGATAAFRLAEGERFVRHDDFRVVDIERILPETRFYDPVNLRVYVQPDKGGKRPKLEFPEPDLLVVTAAPGLFRPVEPGQLFRMRHYHYDLSAFNLTSNQHLTLRRVRVAGAPGMGVVVAGDQRHWQFLDCAVAPPEGSNRIVSTTADAMHVVGSAGDFLMENCELAWSADDGMNIHDLNGFARRLDDGRRIRLVNLNNHPADFYRVGDPLELLEDDFSPTGFVAVAREVDRRSQKECDVTFDRAPPTPAGRGFVVLNRRMGTRNVVLRNNHFHRVPRGLVLMARDVTLEGNRFEDLNCAGLMLESGYTLSLWSEGYGVENVLIRGNHFRMANPRARYPGENSPDIYINSYLGNTPNDPPPPRRSHYPVVRRVWFDGNEFTESAGSPIFVRTGGEILISGNRFVNRRPMPIRAPERAAVGVAESGNVRVLNNLWVANDPEWKTGVSYDPDTVTSLEAGGNRLAAPNAPGTNSL